MRLNVRIVSAEFPYDRAPHLRTVESGQGLEFLRREAPDQGLHHDSAHTVRLDQLVHSPGSLFTLCHRPERSKLADAVGDKLSRRRCRKIPLGGDPPVLQGIPRTPSAAGRGKLGRRRCRKIPLGGDSPVLQRVRRPPLAVGRGRHRQTNDDHHHSAKSKLKVLHGLLLSQVVGHLQPLRLFRV